MDISIWKELHFFWVSILYGGGIVLFYDIFRCMRKVMKHNTLMVAVEDLIFWITTGVIIFSLLYQYNSGSIRGYSILGMGIGMIVYSYTISRGLFFVLGFLSKYIKLGFNKLFRRPLSWIRKRQRKLKKELKKAIETVKMTIRGK